MRAGRAITAAFLLLSSLPAAAQTDNVPLMGSSAASGAGEAVAPEEKHATSVLTIGDALAGGLGAGLSRVTEASGDYEVGIRFNEESGLARPEVYDWAATLPKILEGNAYDVIVVMLGANDRQTIRDGDMRYEFGSKEWTDTYSAQANRLLDQLAASGARVIWVAPPPMREPDYDAAMRSIAALQKELVEKHGMSFLDLRPQFTSPDGSYVDAVADSTGTMVKLRGRDGISFYKTGNNLMGERVLAAISAGADEPAPGKSARLDVPAANKTDAEPRPDAVPLFGQAVMDGPAYTVQPQGVTANAILLAAGDLGPEAALKTLRDIAPSGSGAERLFKLGSPETAPAGRADDFTAP